MHPFLNIAIRAAREAGDLIRKASERLDSIEVESKSRNDFVTEVDRASERIIVDIIKKAYPTHAILTEETGFIASSAEKAEFTWVIDPLDGTTNFIHGIPHYAVSIAVKQGNQIQHGVIYDPIKEDEFTASRGGGAQLNNKRIRVSGRKSLEGALLGTGLPFREDQMTLLEGYMKSLSYFMQNTAGIRRAGSAALDLAYVASGRLDGFWEYGLQEWDLAAGILMVQEAGGLVSDPQGGSNHLNSGNVVCAPPKVFKSLLQHIQPTWPSSIKA